MAAPPCFILPFFLQPKSEAEKPFTQRYWVKASPACSSCCCLQCHCYWCTGHAADAARSCCCSCTAGHRSGTLPSALQANAWIAVFSFIGNYFW